MCSVDCFLKLKKKQQQKTKYDFIQEYSQSLVYHGLVDMATRAIIRNGDGPTLNRAWRIMTVDFHFNHHNYFVTGHSLLAGKIRTEQVVAPKGLDISCSTTVVMPNFFQGTESVAKALWDSNKQDSIFLMIENNPT